MKKLILLITLLFTSCQMSEEKGTYTGIDHTGKTKTCAQIKEGAMCTEIFTEADSYAMKCKEQGKKVIQCDCHDFICLDK